MLTMKASRVRRELQKKQTEANFRQHQSDCARFNLAVTRHETFSEPSPENLIFEDGGLVYMGIEGNNMEIEFCPFCGKKLKQEAYNGL